VVARPSHRVPEPSAAQSRERRGYKALTVAAALYVLLPFDVIPDFIPFVGRFDDALVVSLVLASARQQWLDKLRRLVRGRRIRPQPHAV
jgi:uncharacterized membrane protein YkvA (DUF1232 family)